MAKIRDVEDDFDLRMKAAAVIEREKDEIFTRWEAVVREELEVAKNQDHLLLRNHLLPFIHAIAELLQSKTIQEAKSKIEDPNYFGSIANRSHGRLRATLPGYQVSDVIEEYNALRFVITDVLDHHGLLNTAVMEIIVAENERAIAQAASYFANSIQTLRKKAISMLMHDIRNPLNVISTIAELVKMTAPNHQHEMEVVGRAVVKIDGMVSDLLDAVRLEAGQGLELDFDYCDLRKIVALAVEGAQLAYPNRIEMAVPEHPTQRMIDATAISRALENLISNAIKYGNPTTRVKVMVEEASGFYSIAVHNWGAAIDERDQESLFVTFARSQNPEKNFVSKGWGLGLAYVKAIAEGHGGRVQVQSTEEQGTTFTILLPKEFTPPN